MQQSTLPKSPLLIATIQLGLLVSGIYYTFIGGQTAQGIYDHNWRLITLWLTTGVIGSWLLWQFLSSHNMPRTPLDFPLLFLLIAWILATIFSVNPVYSQETLVFFVTYLFFFYIAADLGRWSWFTELVFNAIIGVSGLVWTLALLQLSWWYQDQVTIPRLLQNSHEPFLSLPRLSVLGNPNTMASYVALVLPIAIYKMTVVHKGMTRILLGLWIVMLSGVILLTQSRGGVLGLVVAVSFYVLVWVFQKTGIFAAGLADTNTVSPGPKVRKRIWLLGSVVIGLIGLFTWLLLGFRTLDQAVNVRQQVMAGAFKTLLKHPLFGAGPGTLGEELIRHQKPLDMIWADAHNLFLTVITETGLVGAVGLLWLGVTGLKIVWSTLRQTDRSQWNMASMACLAALLGFITHNMVDSLFKFPLIMFLVAILAGFWLSPHLSFGPDTSSSVSKFWRYPVIIVAAGVVIANTVIGIRGIENIKAYNQAVQAANQGDWPATLNFLKSSHQLAPTVPFYQRQLGLVAGYLSEQRPTYRQEAISHYKAALKGLDQLAIDHANLGCLLWANGQRAEALQEMTLARDLEPGHLLYHLNLGHYLELEGKHETAWLEYAQVLAAQPDYLQSSYWHQTEQRAEALPEIVQGAIQRLSDDEEEVSLSSLIQLHLYRNDWQAAWQVYDEYKNTVDPVRSHLEKGRILLAMERLDEAQLEFEAAIQTDPQASEAYLHLSKIALAQNNEVEAEQYVGAALFLGQNPATLYQGALVAQATGNEIEAIQHYEDAFAQLTVAFDINLSRYATEVARRRPLPVSYLPCLIRIYPTQLLVDITQAEGNLLEKQGNYLRASQVYRRLLSYEPTIDPIAAKLARLCDDHSGICDN